uniref:Nucleosome assembly protein 1-like 1 n=1 Tax=Glossina brevipalpis TaxID=37001 RepID=A0A1A9WC04_9MUSC
MEVKARNITKIPKSAEKKKPQQAEKIYILRTLIIRSDKGTKEPTYTEDEKKCIVDLKKLYLETIKLDVELQKEIYNLEKFYETKHNEIYDKRNKLLEDFKKQTHGGDAGEQGNVTDFWLKVLKASYTEFISKRDEKILVSHDMSLHLFILLVFSDHSDNPYRYLADIRAKLYNEPVVKFVIEFYFEPNDYISNRILTKTYFLNCLPDADDPLSYDGAEIYKCEGCKIDWKRSEKDPDKKGFTSFFDFFNPPTLPEDPEDPNYCDINAILQNDFELGFYLKERVIPKAIMFFTGEIADCQSSESDSDSDEDDDDEEDEDNSSTNSGAANTNANA